jgi:hypothetical protein
VHAGGGPPGHAQSASGAAPAGTWQQRAAGSPTGPHLLEPVQVDVLLVQQPHLGLPRGRPALRLMRRRSSAWLGNGCLAINCGLQGGSGPG